MRGSKLTDKANIKYYKQRGLYTKAALHEEVLLCELRPSSLIIIRVKYGVANVAVTYELGNAR